MEAVEKDKSIKEHEQQESGMKASEITTYCCGSRLKMTRDVTSGDLCKACEHLNRVYGEGYRFEPECISEGGILLSSWPGKTAGMYKSLRLNCPDHRYRTDRTAEEVIYPHGRDRGGRYIQTILKAFHEAPAWTLEELRTVCSALHMHAALQPRSYPRAKDMVFVQH